MSIASARACRACFDPSQATRMLLNTAGPPLRSKRLSRGGAVDVVAFPDQTCEPVPNALDLGGVLLDLGSAGAALREESADEDETPQTQEHVGELALKLPLGTHAAASISSAAPSTTSASAMPGLDSTRIAATIAPASASAAST